MRLGFKIGIIAVFSSFLLMSHNASALMTTFDMTQYTPVVRQVYNLVDCTFVDFSSGSGIVSNYNSLSNCGYGVTATDLKLTKIVTSNQITFKKDDIVEFDVVNYWGTRTSDATMFSWRAFKPNDVTNFYMMGYDNVLNVDGGSWGSVNQGLRFRFYVQNDVYTKVGLLATDANFNPIAEYLQDANGLRWNIINLTVYRKTGKTSVNQEQEDATQNAVDDSESAAQDNSSNTQTTNLIGAFQSFVTALTSLSSTNCNVTLAFPSALGGNMQVNICQNKDHAGNIISVFGSLTLIVFYIPFSLKMLSMIYNEIRSFTNG